MSRLAAIAVFLIAQAGLVKAAEVKVFSTIGVQAALEELAPKFEQATGSSPGPPLPSWLNVCKPARPRI